MNDGVDTLWHTVPGPVKSSWNTLKARVRFTSGFRMAGFDCCRRSCQGMIWSTTSRDSFLRVLLQFHETAIVHTLLAQRQSLDGG
jgi:hypothetical protein